MNKLQRENEELRAQVRALEKKIDELSLVAENATRSYHEILNSRWWRMTAPMRRAGTWVKLHLGHTIPVRTLRYLLNHGLVTTAKKCVSVLFPCLNLPDPAADDATEQHIYLKDKLYHELKHPARARILLVSHEMSLTGAPLVLLYMAEHIQQLGYQPVIMAPQDGPMTKEAVRSGIPVIIDHTILQPNTRIAAIANNYSLVVANTIVCAQVIHELGGTDIPVIWWVHESRASYQDIADSKLLPEQLQDNIHIYSVCDYARDLLQEYRPHYQSDILNYYMPDYGELHPKCKFTLPPHGNRKVFTLIGTMEPRKGHDILADAIRSLSGDVLDQCYFVIVAKAGDQDIIDNIQQLCEQFPDSVKHYPLLNRDEITILHQQTDCLLCTSRDDPLPCVITEALSLGKPVICTENTGYKTILREMGSGLIYPNNDPAMLAQCITDFIRQPALSKSISANARATYDRYFSQKVFAANVNHLLNRWLFRLSGEEADAIRSEGAMGYEAICARDLPSATVSVVIPAYNGGQQLDELLSQLEQQTGIDKLEIIVVDSGSKDDTVQRCRKHQIKLIEIPNSEFSHSGARNMGADAATGDILLFMTQDARPTSAQWLSRLIEPLLKGEAVAVTPREKCPEGTDLYYRVASYMHSRFTHTNKCDQLNMGMGDGDANHFRTMGSLSDVSNAIVRKVFMRFRYRLNFAEDLDMGLRLLRAGYAVKLLNAEEVIHGHNRDAGYYLKRSLVDNTVVSHLIHDENADAAAGEGGRIAGAAVGTYRQMQKVLCAVDRQSYSSLDKYISTIKQLSRMNENHLPAPDKGSIRKELANPLVENTMELLKQYTRFEYVPPEAITGFINFLENCIRPYLETQGPWKQEDTQLVNACMYKYMVILIAGNLSRINKADSVYEVIQPLMQGI